MKDIGKNTIESFREPQMSISYEIGYRQGQMDALYQMVGLLKFLAPSQKKPLTIEFIQDIKNDLIDLWARKARHG